MGIFNQASELGKIKGVPTDARTGNGNWTEYLSIRGYRENPLVNERESNKRKEFTKRVNTLTMLVPKMPKLTAERFIHHLNMYIGKERNDAPIIWTGRTIKVGVSSKLHKTLKGKECKVVDDLGKMLRISHNGKKYKV